jgi:hypothetical protein
MIDGEVFDPNELHIAGSLMTRSWADTRQGYCRVIVESRLLCCMILSLSLIPAFVCPFFSLLVVWRPALPFLLWPPIPCLIADGDRKVLAAGFLVVICRAEGFCLMITWSPL